MKITKQRLKEIIKEEISEATDSMALAHDELNKAMAAIENAYKNEATRAVTQQVVDELYQRFGRTAESPEELIPDA
jgi:hypothetical protein